MSEEHHISLDRFKRKAETGGEAREGLYATADPPTAAAPATPEEPKVHLAPEPAAPPPAAKKEGEERGASSASPRRATLHIHPYLMETRAFVEGIEPEDRPKLVENVRSALVEIEAKERHQRTEARHARYDGVEARPLLPETPATPSRWGEHVEYLQNQRESDEHAAHVTALVGHWPLDVSVNGASAAELGLAAELNLGADHSFTLIMSCWSSDAADASNGELRVAGRWQLDEHCHWCCLRGCQSSSVRLRVQNGRESGAGCRGLPFRWARLPWVVHGRLHATRRTELDEPSIHATLRIGQRDWMFTRSHGALWQERCALAGLRSPGHLDEFIPPTTTAHDKSASDDACPSWDEALRGMWGFLVEWLTKR